jgi:hypothetical protein
MIGRAVAAAYVLVVAAVTAHAFWPGTDGFNASEGVAGVLTVPLILPALPIIYVVGALAWQVGGTESGQPTSVVTVAFTAMMALVALANVALVAAVRRRRRRARQGVQAQASSERPSTLS